MSNEHYPSAGRLSRAASRERTRERLLSAAATEFAANGYAGASVEGIAERAGFTIGALYSNFGGKQELFMELLTRTAAARVQQAERILTESTPPAKDIRPALSRMLTSAADGDDDHVLLQTELWLYAVRNPEAAPPLTAQAEATRQALAATVTQTFGIDLGRATELTTIALAAFQGLLQQRRLDRESVPDELFGRALDWLLAGLQADGEASR